MTGRNSITLRISPWTVTKRRGSGSNQRSLECPVPRIQNHQRRSQVTLKAHFGGNQRGNSQVTTCEVRNHVCLFQKPTNRSSIPAESKLATPIPPVPPLPTNSLRRKGRIDSLVFKPPTPEEVPLKKKRVVSSSTTKKKPHLIRNPGGASTPKGQYRPQKPTLDPLIDVSP